MEPNELAVLVAAWEALHEAFKKDRANKALECATYRAGSAVRQHMRDHVAPSEEGQDEVAWAVQRQSARASIADLWLP